MLTFSPAKYILSENVPAEHPGITRFSKTPTEGKRGHSDRAWSSRCLWGMGAWTWGKSLSLGISRRAALCQDCMSMESWGKEDLSLNVRRPHRDLQVDEAWDIEAGPSHHDEAVGHTKVKPGCPRPLTGQGCLGSPLCRPDKSKA